MTTGVHVPNLLGVAVGTAGEVEQRVQLARMGAPPDPQIEGDLVAIAERVTSLLSNREENRP